MLGGRCPWLDMLGGWRGSNKGPSGRRGEGDREGWIACGKTLIGGLFRGQRHSPRLGRLVEVVSGPGPMESRPRGVWLAVRGCCDRAMGWKQLHGETQ